MKNNTIFFLLPILLQTSLLWAQCPISLDLGPDIYACTPPSPATIQLHAAVTGDTLNFQWLPNVPTVQSKLLNPVIKTVAPQSTFIAKATAISQTNLVFNGDFEQGNTGFTTALWYSPGDLTNATLPSYDILTNPADDNPNFANCHDHTTGSGNLMAVGAGPGNMTTWCQTIAVEPNTDYYVSFWECRTWFIDHLEYVHNRYRILMDGVVIYSQPNGGICAWHQIKTKWNSGNHTSIEYCIDVVRNLPTHPGKYVYSFAIDDIEMHPVCTLTDTVKVFVQPIAITSPASYSIACTGAPIVLDGTKGSTPPGTFISYEWETNEGNVVSGGHTLTPTVDQAGDYNLHVQYQSDTHTCELETTFVVFNSLPLLASILPLQQLDCLHPKVSLKAVPNTAGNVKFSWTASNGGHITNGDTSALAIIDQPGLYQVVVTNTQTGCTATAEYVIPPPPPLPVANASATPITCAQTQATLSGAGSSTGSHISYLWTTPNGLIGSDPQKMNAAAAMPGTYILQVRTDKGCTTYDTVQVVHDLAKPTLAIATPEVLECNQPDTIALSSTFTPANAILSWTASNGGNIVGGAASATPQVNTAGTYTLLATHPTSGCTASASVAVLSTINLMASIAPPGILTCTQPHLVLNAAGSSAGPGIGYLWSSPDGLIQSGATTLFPTIAAPGAYHLLVIDSASNCFKSLKINVLENKLAPQVVVEPAPKLHCLLPTAQLVATRLDSLPNVAIQWTSANGNLLAGAQSLTPTIAAEGVYHLLLTHPDNGCTTEITVPVTADFQAPVAQIAPAPALNCTTLNLDLNATASSASSQILYDWAASNGGHLVSGNTSPAPNIDQPGAYTLLVTDPVNGCTTTASILVALDQTPPSVDAGPGGTLTCALTSIDLSATASGGYIGYQWIASNGGHIVSGSTTAAPKIDQPGTYTLLVTHLNNGCTATDTVLIALDKDSPVAEAGPPVVLTCTLASAALQGSGSTGPRFSYLWTSPDGNIVSGENTLMPIVNKSGTYTLQVIDHQNGCSDSDPVFVQKEADVPTAQIQAPGVLDCLHPTVPLHALNSSQGPGISFSWSTLDGHFLSGQNSLSPVVDAPGLYTLNILNTTSNCTVSTSVNVQQNRLSPLAQIAPPAPITCSNKSATLDANASSQGSQYAYSWTAASSGYIVSGNNTLAPIVNQPGTYTLLVSDATNGCTATSTIVVVSNTTPPQAKAGPSALLTCTASMVALNGSGSTGPDFSYQWTSAAGSVITGGNTLTPTVSAADTYTLQVTDHQNGCTASDAVMVQKDVNAPDAVVQTPGALNCKTPALQLSASASSQGANYVYLWSATTGGHVLAGNTTLSPTVNQPGNYALLVTNTANGCTATANIAVTEDRTQPLASAAAPTLNCKTPTIALDGNGSSQGAFFNYLWTTSGSGNILSGQTSLAPIVNQSGNYTLLVTNSQNGCTASATATALLDQTAPSAQIAPAAQLDCAVTALTLNATGSAQGANILYNWTASASGNIFAGQGTLTPTIHQPGAYHLLVTNTDNGCTASATVAVNRDAVPPTAAIAPPAVLNCTVQSLLLNGNNSSHGNQLTYQWTATNGGNILSGNTTLTPDINQPGTYKLLITNTDNHCTAVASVTVTQDLTQPQITTGPPSTLNCSTSSLALSASVTGAGSSFEISWSTLNGWILSGEKTLSPLVGAAGVYTLEIKNLQNSCSQTAEATVLKDLNAPVSAAGTPAELTCKTTQVTLSGAGSSTGNNITYQWTAVNGAGIVSGEHTLSPTVNQPGAYLLAVTNTTNNCTATTTVSVSQNIQPPPAGAQANGLLTCAVQQISLEATGMGGVNGVAYAWAGAGIASGAHTAAPVVTTPGLYNLTVTDLTNGCSATALTTVGQDVAPPVGVVASPAMLNCLVKDLTLQASVSKPDNGQYSAVWAGAGVVSGTNTLTPTVNQPGTYTLQVTSTDNGCKASWSAVVTQDIEPPVAEANQGFELNCTVNEGNLSAVGSSAGGNIQYHWTPTGNGHIVSGSNTATPLINTPGIYTLTVQDLNNHCTATDMAEVTQNTNMPTALQLVQQPPNCKHSTGSIKIVAVEGGQGPYLYSLDGGLSFGAASQFNQLLPGAYSLVVQDANGCQHEQPLIFDVPTQPSVTLGPDLHWVFGETGKLTATVNLPPSQIASVTWSPMEGLTLTADPLVVLAQPLKSTYYTVKVINTDGCEAKVSQRVQVNEPHIWAPNVFSPRRRDAQNDYFLLFSSEGSVLSVKTLQVFDRWGTMIFQNNDLQPNVEKMGWDGSFRGEVVEPAVFVWYAEVLLADGQVVVLKGDVTVVD